MLITLGELRADFVPPESRKFKAPVVMVHELWSSSAQWSEWANHLANLGWECWAVNLPGRANDSRARARPTFSACVDELGKALRNISFPPVLLAHGLGALVASKAAERAQVTALVFVSPHSAQAADALRLLRLKYFALRWFRRPILLQEKDFRELFLASVRESRRAEILKRFVPESADLAREFLRPELAPGLARPTCPALVIGGTEDKIAPVSVLRASAHAMGADFLVFENHGHWIMEEGDGERIVGDIHRWLVHKLGEGILTAEFPHGTP
ncbi:MAG TPA: alpha/beta fold hydrolase [Candidatus Acidoferrales bacterium]|nr:alpha/beta fold hydrolase [Candidatus Acidoferrales bacterium]